MIEKANDTSITKEDTKLVNLNEESIPTDTNQLSDVNTKEILSAHGFSNITFIGSGWSSEAYNAIHDGKDYIIRIPKVGGDGFKEYKREHALLEILANKISSVKIPRTYLYESDGLQYVVHEKIIGNSFDRNYFEKFSKKEQDNFCQSVANFFNELHSININEFSNVSGLRWDKIKTDFLMESFEKYLKFFKEEGWEESLIFSKREIDTFCKLMASITSINNPEVLLHRDFYESNFVIDDQMHLTGVFDFGNCSIAERSTEFKCFTKLNDDGTFKETLLLKKILFFYKQASGIHIPFNDVVNQAILADAFCITWLVSSDNILYNNKDNLRDCVKRIKKWLERYMAENV